MVIITAKHTFFASTENFTCTMPATAEGRDLHFVDTVLEHREINSPAHGILLSL